jgi:hypothetical protein
VHDDHVITLCWLFAPLLDRFHFLSLILSLLSVKNNSLSFYLEISVSSCRSHRPRSCSPVAMLILSCVCSPSRLRLVVHFLMPSRSPLPSSSPPNSDWLKKLINFYSTNLSTNMLIETKKNIYIIGLYDYVTGYVNPKEPIRNTVNN